MTPRRVPHRRAAIPARDSPRVVSQRASNPIFIIFLLTPSTFGLIVRHRVRVMNRLSLFVKVSH